MRFVEPQLRKKLFIIEKGFPWKRKIDLKERSFKEEYWLVTNRK